MNRAIVKAGAALAASILALGGLSHAAFAADGAGSGDSATGASWQDSRAIVFGRFKLLKNGNEVQLGDGLFGNVASLRLYRPEDQEEFTGRVGKNGMISMKLSPGEYYVTSVAFKHQGETIEPDTNFRFVVSADHRASYIGTITLETTFSGSYNGMKGSLDRVLIQDECASDCAAQLHALGLGEGELDVALPHWQERLAFNDR